MSETPDITKQAIQKLGVALNQYVQTIADPYAKTCAMEDINRNLAVVQDKLEAQDAEIAYKTRIIRELSDTRDCLLQKIKELSPKCD